MEIIVDTQELKNFSDTLDEVLGRTTALDEFIPLPNISQDEQIDRIKSDHSHTDETYWRISNDHGHGWCCGYCGTVIQWG